jgi:CRISPR-associated endoribonuclease Cas6
MRFQLTLQVDKQAFGDCLPLSYQYELSSFIYKAIAQADSSYSSWLHENGFLLNGRPFKLFTFSNLMIPKYEILRERGLLRIDCDRIVWQVSFLPEASTEKFVFGLFSEQVFQVGNRNAAVQFRIAQIKTLPPPVFREEMAFRTLSPVCILHRRTGIRHFDYLSPEHPEAAGSVRDNLLSKYMAFYDKPFDGAFDFVFQPSGQPKAKLITIKAGTAQASNVRGFMFNFVMKAPEELMRIAYECGIGSEGSQGFGMVETRDTSNKNSPDTFRS